MAAIITPVVFTLLLVFLVISKLLGISKVKEKPRGIPNGSKWYFPLLGETLSNLKQHESTSLGTFLHEHCSRYGNVFTSHLSGSPTIVSCDLELNSFIFQNEDKLFQNSYPKPVRDILGESCILIATGDLHKRLKTVAVGFLRVSKSRPDILHHVDNLCLSFVNSCKAEKKILFYKEAKRLTFHVMLKILLNIEPEDPLAEKILQDFLKLMKGFVSLPVYIPGTAYSKAVKARRRLLSTLKGIIKEREKETRRRGDFLDEVLICNGLNEEEKVSIVLDLLFAGYETTSGLMALVVYFTAQDPSSLQTLQEEQHLVRKRKKDGEPLNWEDYKRMEFTSHVMNEALRCGNVVKNLYRKAIKDAKFKEYTIPAGWEVHPVLSAPHLDPSLHEHPTKFNPWRWKDPSTSRKVILFGGGSRLCPGAEFAKLETAFFLDHFILNLRWKTGEEEYPISCPYLDFNKGLELEIKPIQSY